MRSYVAGLMTLLFVLLNSSGSAPDTTSVDLQSTIKISTEVDRKEVPTNRLVTCSVIVEWTGDLKRYQISEIENPVVENFDIVKTSAADRRLSEGGVARAARIYEFVLQPKSIGMGYVENVIVKYIDNLTGEGESLITPRLNIKIVDAVPEPGSKGWLVKWIVLALVLLAAGIVLWLWQKRKNERKRQAASAIKVIPLETEYLNQLRESLNLKLPDIKISESFGVLSKIARKYLAQKYQIPALELTSEKIIAELALKNLDPNLLNNIQEILTVSDLAKFAGSEGNRSELDRSFTLLEAILERNLGEANAEGVAAHP